MSEPATGARLPPLLTRRRSPRFGALIGVGAVQAAAAGITAWILERAFESLATPSRIDLRMMLGAGAVLLGAAIMAAWSRGAERVWAEQVGQSYIHDVRRALSRVLVEARPRAIERRSGGAVMLRFVGDLTAIRRWVSLGLARLIVAGAASTGALGALIVLNQAMGLGVLLAVALGAVAALAHGSALRDAARAARRRRARLAGNIGEKIASLAVVQAFGAGDRERRQLARQSRRLRDAMIDRAGVSGRVDAVAEATGGMALALTVVLGMAEVHAGRASPGTIAGAMALIGLIVPALRDLGRVVQYRHEATVAREKLIAFLETPVVEEERLPALTVGDGRLEVCDVTVPGALKGVRAVAEPGSRVAVVGPNGSGKSTLLAVIARLVEPEEGEVRIGGQSLAEHNADSLRRAIGVVSPELPLLRGTVNENLRYRWPDAPDEEVARIRQRCELDELILRLPEGEETRIARLGAGLSSGERLRIALARALLGDPAILLLDEADANLDPRSASIVERVISDFAGTVLYVSHRPGLVRLADAIWHLEGGRLVASEPAARRADECVLIEGSSTPHRPAAGSEAHRECGVAGGRHR